MDILIKVKIHLLRLWLTSDKIFPILFSDPLFVYFMYLSIEQNDVCLPGVN